MLDLNSTLFYKAKLQVQTQNSEQDLLWNLVLKIRNWMIPKWKRNNEQIPERMAIWSKWKKGSNFSSENNVVHFKSVYHHDTKGLEFWACKIVESWPSENGCAPREWTTEIGFQPESDGEKVSISIVIYYNDRPGFIGPCQSIPEASIPKIIKMLVQDPMLKCTVDGYLFDLKAIHLVPGMFPEFWKVVCDKKREIPIIYISPRRVDENSNQANCLLDPSKLVEVLGPNAFVYYSNDIDFSREMTQLCAPPDLGCYSGALRVYAPHLDIENENESYRHRLITARMISEMGEEVYTILRRALAQDVHFYDKMFRVEDCKELNDRIDAEKRRQEYRCKLENDLLETAVEKESCLQAELNKIVDERLEWEIAQEGYEDKIKELKNDLRLSQAMEDVYRNEVRVSSERKKALDCVRMIEKYPESPQEIATYFEAHFPDRIAFTNRGKASLNDCTTSSEVLWDALYQMATTLYDLFEDDDIVLVDKEFNQKSKLQMARSEGKMTRKDATLLRQYVDTYCGKEIDIQAHIKTSEIRDTNPKFLRIYFYYDSDIHKIIIGSCGKHLDNYTTQKIK